MKPFFRVMHLVGDNIDTGPMHVESSNGCPSRGAYGKEGESGYWWLPAGKASSDLKWCIIEKNVGMPMILGYKCEPLKDPDHGAFLQRVFIRSNEVPRSAGMRWQREWMGGRHRRGVIGLSAGALGRGCPPTWVGWESALALRGSTASCVQGRTRRHALWVANSR